MVDVHDGCLSQVLMDMTRATVCGLWGLTVLYSRPVVTDYSSYCFLFTVADNRQQLYRQCVVSHEATNQNKDLLNINSRSFSQISQVRLTVR